MICKKCGKLDSCEHTNAEYQGLRPTIIISGLSNATITVDCYEDELIGANKYQFSFVDCRNVAVLAGKGSRDERPVTIH